VPPPEPDPQPFYLGQMATRPAAPRRAKTNWLAVAAATAAGLVLLGVCAVAAINGRRSDDPSTDVPAAARTTPGAPPPACAEVIPLVRRVSTLVQAALDRPDLGTVNAAELAAVLGALQTLVVPESMQGDVRGQSFTLAQIKDKAGSLDLGPYYSSAASLSTVCAMSFTVATPRPQAPTTQAPPPPPPPPAGPRTSFDDGTWLVGADIAPGRYRATVPAGGHCYWARLRNTTGGSDSIIANDLKDKGQSVVTILKSDNAFETSGCGTWTRA
jgi:hypothetical protein